MSQDEEHLMLSGPSWSNRPCIEALLEIKEKYDVKISFK